TTSSTASRLLGVDRNASTPSARRPGGPFRQAGDRSPFAVGSLERRDLELPHLEHLHHDALRVPGLRITEPCSEAPGFDLSGEAELIRQPAARTFFASLGKRLPEAVNLRLRLAFDHDGGAVREGEGRSAVERRVDRPTEPERRVPQPASRVWSVRAAAACA